MSKRFQKRVEDFVCAQCGFSVIGNGYTNHCPQCLWSRHVDVFPGDRQEPCAGMMKPISYEQEGKRMMITHQCVSCGFERRNAFLDTDNIDALTVYTKK